MGEPNELRPGSGEFHENPSSCICQNSEAKTGGISNRPDQSRDSLEGIVNKDIFAMTEDQFTEEEPEPLPVRTDQTELQEFFSD